MLLLLFVSASGHVGIGTTSPGYPLHVYNLATSATAQLQNHDGSDPLGLDIYWSNAAPNDTTQWFVQGRDTEGDEFKIYADGSYSQISDRRRKQNITNSSGSLDKVNQLRVVDYNRIGDVSQSLHIGVIAQEVEEVFPHLVTTSDDVSGSQMLYKIGMIPLLIKSVQELTQAHRDLRAQITGSTDINQLKALVTGSTFA